MGYFPQTEAQVVWIFCHSTTHSVAVILQDNKYNHVMNEDDL